VTESASSPNVGTAFNLTFGGEMTGGDGELDNKLSSPEDSSRISVFWVSGTSWVSVLSGSSTRGGDVDRSGGPREPTPEGSGVGCLDSDDWTGEATDGPDSGVFSFSWGIFSSSTLSAATTAVVRIASDFTGGEVGLEAAVAFSLGLADVVGTDDVPRLGWLRFRYFRQHHRSQQKSLRCIVEVLVLPGYLELEMHAVSHVGLNFTNGEKVTQVDPVSSLIDTSYYSKSTWLW